MLLWSPSLRLLPRIAALLVLRATLILRATLVLLLSMWLDVILLMPMVLLVASNILTKLWRHLCRTSSQVDIYSTCICLGSILQAKLLTDLFDPRLELVNMVDGMIAFSYDTFPRSPISSSRLGIES